jgi:hypothetical protein
MKRVRMLTLGVLMLGHTAFAASAHSSVPTATPAAAAQPAHKHNSTKRCEKLAASRGLTDDAAARFMKECRDGKLPT